MTSTQESGQNATLFNIRSQVVIMLTIRLNDHTSCTKYGRELLFVATSMYVARRNKRKEHKNLFYYFTIPKNMTLTKQCQVRLRLPFKLWSWFFWRFFSCEQVLIFNNSSKANPVDSFCPWTGLYHSREQI